VNLMLNLGLNDTRFSSPGIGGVTLSARLNSRHTPRHKADFGWHSTRVTIFEVEIELESTEQATVQGRFPEDQRSSRGSIHTDSE